DANPARLRSHPQLEIDRSVVVLDAVEMVHGLLRPQVTAEHPLHHDDVFEHVRTAWVRPWMSRNAAHHVPRLVKRFAAAPVAVRFANGRLAGPTRRGRRLLRVSARAQVPRRPATT